MFWHFYVLCWTEEYLKITVRNVYECLFQYDMDFVAVKVQGSIVTVQDSNAQAYGPPRNDVRSDAALISFSTIDYALQGWFSVQMNCSAAKIRSVKQNRY